MVILDRESMAEDVRERYDVLSARERQVVEALMEAGDYSLEEALDMVESGVYDFYFEDDTTLAMLVATGPRILWCLSQKGS